MKKLLILTAVLLLTGSAAGCRCCPGLWRGAAWSPCPPVVTYTDPCDPCATLPPATPSPTLTPGPAPYVEAPAP